MKAVIQTRYGGPELLKLVSTPIPTVKENEILIQIKATNVSSGDWRVNTLSVPTILKPIMRSIFGFRGPRQKIRGITGAGTIIKTGSKVSSFEPGGHVYFINSIKAGCLAEFIVLKESSIIAKIPDTMNFTEAAPLAFGAMTAYHFINKNTIQQNMEVLIYGASGSVGSYAVQLAKYYGAEVTAVSSFKHHKELLKLGADHVIDYTQHDFRTDLKQFDVILDAVGKISKGSCKAVLNPTGKYYTVKSPTKEDSCRLESINKIIEEGRMKTLIDKVYPFNEFKEAHIHVYDGHKCGNVIIQVI